MKDYNFFDYLLREKKSKKIKFINIAIIIFVMCSVMLTTYLINFRMIKKLNTDIVKNKATIEYQNYEVINSTIAEKQKMLAIIEEYNGIVGGINTLISNSDKINKDLLVNINKTIPQNIKLDYISLNSQFIFIDGVSTTRQAVAEFQYNLKETELFSNIHVSNITSDEEAFTFSVEIELKGGAEDETD